MANIDILRDQPRALTQSSQPWGSFLNEFDSMFREFDRMLDPFRNRVVSYQSSAYDVDETDSEFLLSCDLPGMKKSDIDIQVTGNRLTISGERKTEKKSKQDQYTERRYGRFQQSFNLPDNIDTDKLEASYEDGVLYLALPKTESSQAKHVEISEKGSLLKRLIAKKEEQQKAAAS